MFKTIQNPQFNTNFTTVPMTITFNHDFNNSNCAPESKSVSIPSGVTLNVYGLTQTHKLWFLGTIGVNYLARRGRSYMLTRVDNHKMIRDTQQKRCQRLANCPI